jgi:SET domain-containing protein
MNERTNDRIIGRTNDRNFGSITAGQRLSGRTMNTDYERMMNRNYERTDERSNDRTNEQSEFWQHNDRKKIRGRDERISGRMRGLVGD